MTARLDHGADSVERITISRPEVRNAFDAALIATLVGLAGYPPAEVRERTMRTIADIRATPEAQEGFRAFLERRAPRW